MVWRALEIEKCQNERVCTAGGDFLITVPVLLQEISQITSEERNISSFQYEQFQIYSFAMKIQKNINREHRECTDLKSLFKNTFAVLASSSISCFIVLL